jgi:hypothetical protein
VGDLMIELLDHFEEVFAASTGLPPRWERNHQIWLLSGTALVGVWPYCYVHAQKAELKHQCTEMLEQGIIKLSSSMFSAPVLLMKKHNNS